MKYQKANAAATTPATPPTTPPTIPPVSFDEGLGVPVFEEDVFDNADVGDAVGAAVDDADEVETAFPSSRYTPLRWLQHVCPAS